MIALAHRGYWRERGEQNTMAAFRRAWDIGCGIETDIRDCAGELVVSHDPPGAGEAMTLAALLGMAAQYPVPLALNIKADGLAGRVCDMARAAGVADWFVFDMSVPDTLAWRRLGAPYLTRRSDYEGPGRLDADAVGIWLDAFDGEWWSAADLAGLLDRGLRVAVVSPELHRRPHAAAWGVLAELAHPKRAEVMVCTDFPEAFLKSVG